MLTIETVQGRETKVEAGSSFEEADVAVGARLAHAKDNPVVRVIGALSELGDQPPLAALSAAMLTFGVLADNRRATQAGLRMLGALALSYGLKTGLKHLVARTRPNVLLDEGRYEVEPFGPDSGGWHSFPSGHTAGSVAVARALGRVYPGMRTTAYAGAAAVALAQIPRGAHYPADVAAGALVGVVAEAVGDMIARSVLPRSDVEVSPSARGAPVRTSLDVSPSGPAREERMVIRGESTPEQIDAVATDEKFRIKPLSASLATLSDGPRAGLMRYLATEPTLVEALGYTGAKTAGGSGSDAVNPRPINPESYQGILEALKLGYIEISDEVEPDHGLI
jgi:hypothetical protein